VVGEWFVRGSSPHPNPLPEGEGEEQRLGDSLMLDLVFLAVTIAFFVLAWGYVRACERF
jgi:hypothetical protein